MGLGEPTVSDVVVVTGPSRAGVSSMVAELRRRMPGDRFAEPVDLTAGDTPVAVVFVASAVAPIVGSDCELLSEAADVDVVIAVVSKIDDHHDWRRVLAADRRQLAHYAAGLGDVPWVGAAAAPRLGDPAMDELVALLDAHLRDPVVRSRNALRMNPFRRDLLRVERERLLRCRRESALRRAVALRESVQQTRLAVTHDARRRSASLRADLTREASALTRRQVAGFAERVRRHCDGVLAAVDEDVAVHTGRAAPQQPASVDLPGPALRSRRLENRLMTVLGAGFGLGVALVVTRVVAGLAPGLAAAGLIAGAVAGLATTVWVTRARTLLHDRAVLQGWVQEAAAAVRAVADERVATQLLVYESARGLQSAAAAAAEDADIGEQLAAVEARVRRLARAPTTENLLPAGRTPGDGHLNRSCE